MKERIGILTNVEEDCGNSCYARHLQTALQKFYAVRRSACIEDLEGAEVVIINYHPTVVPVSVDMVKKLKDKKQKVILILQNSTEQEVKVAETDILKAVDAVVAHEPMTGNVKFTYIPHGILELDVPKYDEWGGVGVAGFPFTWKRYDLVAEVAKKFNVPCLMIAPRSKYQDTDKYIDGIKGHLGDLAHIHREWLSEEEVITYLSRCAVNIFWYESKNIDDQFGQTGSARMGVSAKRPMIISTHRKFRTLLPYKDDFYICAKEAEVYKTVEGILKNLDIAKKPNKVFTDMGWTKTGNMYKDLIESL